MKKCLALINNSGIGGAERRFARSFSCLLKEDKEIYLIINLRLYNLLRDANLLSSNENIFILKDIITGTLDRIERRFSSKILFRLLFFTKKIDYIIFALKTRAIFKKNKISVAHLILGGVYIGLPLLFSKKCRVIVSIVCPLKRLVGSRIGYYLYLVALKRADMIDVLNNGIKADLLSFGLPLEKIAVSPGSFTDTVRYSSAREKRDWIVYAGRFHKDKDPLLFVEAIPSVLLSFPQARFFLLGEGPLGIDINRTIQGLGISNSVYVRFLPDIGEILKFSRIFVSIQKVENYPSQSLLEAMACENAIIATDVGETRRLVNEKVGMLTREDAKGLADAIIELLKHPDMTKEMGRYAREKVMREHNIEIFTRYLDDLYRKVMEVRV